MRNRLILLLLLGATGAAAQIPTVTGDAKVRLSLSNSYWDATVNQILSGRVGPDSTWVKLSGSYLNKRITDAVYKHGTLSLRSTDTTGVLNLAPYYAKAGLYIKPKNTYLPANIDGAILLKADLKSHFAGAWDINMSYQVNPDNGSSGADTRPNTVLKIGHNVAGTSNAESGNTAFYDQWESYFYQDINSDGIKEAGMERHWIYLDSAGNQRRPITGFFPYNSGKSSRIEFSCSDLRFFDYLLGKTARLKINSSANTNTPLLIANDTLATYSGSDPLLTSALVLASKDRTSIAGGEATSLYLRGSDASSSLVGIRGQHTTTNKNGNFDMVLSTQGNNSTGEQTDRMVLRAGANTLVGINTLLPAQTFDVNGTALIRGASRVNMTGDSAALILKSASTQTTPIFQHKWNNGTLAFSAHAYDYNATQATTNMNLVFGRTGTIHTLASRNTVFGNTGAAFPTGVGANTLVGYFAGNSLNGGYENTCLGANAGAAITSGFQNAFMGYLAGAETTDGDQNMGIGRRALTKNAGGNRNVGIGSDALRLNVSGNDNIGIGNQAGDAITGNNNVLIGSLAGQTVTGSSNVMIGYATGSSLTSVSNQLLIDNSNTASPLVSGDFSSNELGVNLAPGSLAAAFHVAGNGTTSGTTGLIVEKSDGTDILTVRDDGVSAFGGSPATSVRLTAAATTADSTTFALDAKRSSTSVLKVRADGKVAVNNAAFQDALTVNGKARADGLVLTNQTATNTSSGQVQYNNGGGSHSGYVTVGDGTRQLAFMPTMIERDIVDYNVDWTTGRKGAFWTVPARFDGWKIAKVYIGITNIGSGAGDDELTIEIGGVGEGVQIVTAGTHTLVMDDVINTDDVITFNITEISATPAKGLNVALELSKN